MDMGDLIDMINKEKRKSERVKKAKRLAVGAGVAATLGVITGIFLTTKSVKYSAAHATQEVCNIIKDNQESII